MNRSIVYIITGEQGAGKTSFLIALVQLLRKNNITVGGILAEGTWDNNKRSGFHLLDLSTGQRLPLASVVKRKNWIPLGRFFFNPESISYGNTLLTGDEIQNNTTIVLDEVGPFDLQGNLWATGLHKLRNSYSGMLILSVRKKLVTQIIRHWDFSNVQIIDISRVQVEDLLRRIEEHLHNDRLKKD